MNTTLSINLPDQLAKASQAAAKRMGMSRTEFIRQAIAHEIAQFEAHLEEEEMASAMRAMKKSKHYLNESDEIMNGFSDELPKDNKEWWSKKKS
jgi:metal-responsive CopG/Arc/MetJ family transcriptional regulator